MSTVEMIDRIQFMRDEAHAFLSALYAQTTPLTIIVILVAFCLITIVTLFKRLNNVESAFGMHLGVLTKMEQKVDGALCEVQQRMEQGLFDTILIAFFRTEEGLELLKRAADPTVIAKIMAEDEQALRVLSAAVGQKIINRLASEERTGDGRMEIPTDLLSEEFLESESPVCGSCGADLGKGGLCPAGCMVTTKVEL